MLENNYDNSLFVDDHTNKLILESQGRGAKFEVL